MNPNFIIDANILITPHNDYYPFDMVPSFWEFMKKHIENGDILLLDKVKEELAVGEDELSSWVKNLKNIQLLKSEDHVDSYRQVINYVKDSPVYRSTALEQWVRGDVADPWLIAAAMDTNCILITFENRNSGLNKSRPSKNAKIPDVADNFGVQTEKLFYMLRQLGFKL